MRPFTIERSFKVERRSHGEKHLKVADASGVLPVEIEPGRIPRVSRWMALALRFEGLIRRGEIEAYSELAELGHVTRARITQIMNLLNLAPDLQEALLFLPRVERGRDPVTLGDLQAIALEPIWRKQRRMWGTQSHERSRSKRGGNGASGA